MKLQYTSPTLFLLAFITCLSTTAHATTVNEVEVGAIIAQYRYFTAGQSYTVSTETISSSGDPVLRILDGGFVEVASNDNNGSLDCHPFFGCTADLDASVTFTPNMTGWHVVLVHSKTQAQAGRVNIHVDQTPFLTDREFGGAVIPVSYQPGDRFRATARSRKSGCNALTMFLIKPGCGGICQEGIVDSDMNGSGPNFDAMFTNNSTFPSGATALVGLSGTTSCADGTAKALVTVDKGALGAGDDGDGDGLSSALEALLGTSDAMTDSDEDGIPDTKEVVGNDGFSYATGGFHPSMGPTPATTRNIYTEVLLMAKSPTTPNTPFDLSASLPTDVAGIFLADSPDGIIFEWIESPHNPIPHTTSVSLDNDPACPSPCVDIVTLKSQYFQDPSKVHFHVGVLGDEVYPPATGWGELGGNDYILSLDAMDRVSGGDPVLYDQYVLGLFMHEIGHNLGLDHNFNGNEYPPNSTLHKSVMSYEYMFNGVPPNGRSTYSHGTFDAQGNLVCNDCETSSKGWCVFLRTNLSCSYGAYASGSWGDYCDCDWDEWGTLEVDAYRTGSLGWGDGPQANETRSRPNSQPQARVVQASHHEFRPPSGREKRQRAALMRARLEARGYKQGVDFRVNADESRVSMP